jgi:ABC-2 type transport system ATP-binding protein
MEVHMIELQNLTKRYGDKTAVDDVTFTVRPGVVTGFLGPNGAGKSTTMRMLVGLDAPDSGSSRVNGRSYLHHKAPIHELGVLLEARATHPGRSARNHLLALAHTHGIGVRRVDEVLDLVGLSEVARRRAGEFSLGMGQRLGIAAALLGDPATVMLDEPVNGLDPEGIRWMRALLRRLSGEGRTVFVSSHLVNELAETAEHLIVLGRGRLLADISVSELMGQRPGSVRVRTFEARALAHHLVGEGVTVSTAPDGLIEVTGLGAAQIGARAFAAGLVLEELTPIRTTLEDEFMRLTGADVEFRGDLGSLAAFDDVEVA